MTDDDPWTVEGSSDDENDDRQDADPSPDDVDPRDAEIPMDGTDQPSDEDRTHRDPFAPRDTSTGRGADPAPEAGEPARDAGRTAGESGEGAVADPGDDGDAPMADLAREVRERRQRRERDDSTDLFESVDVGELDSEDVWESLASTDADSAEEKREAGSGSEAEARSASTAGTGVGVGATAERVSGSGGRPEFVVPKSDYCEQCAYLSAPPDLECSYEGSTIVAVEDSERFRVRGCPFVDRDPDDPTAGLAPEGNDEVGSDAVGGDSGDGVAADAGATADADADAEATADAGTTANADADAGATADADAVDPFLDLDDDESVLDGEAPDPTIDPESNGSDDR